MSFKFINVGLIFSLLTLLLTSCGGDDGDSSGAAAPSTSNSPALTTSLQNTVTILNNVGDLGTFAGTRSLPSGPCEATPTGSSPNYATLTDIWESECFSNNASGLAHTKTSKTFVSQQLDPSIPNGWTNGPNVLTNIKERLAIPCVLTVGLQPSQFDQNTGIPLPGSYTINLTQTLVDTISASCGGISTNEDLGGSLDIEVSSLPQSGSTTFSTKLEITFHFPEEPVFHDTYFFGNPFPGYLNIGSTFNNVVTSTNDDGSEFIEDEKAYALLIYTEPGVITYEQIAKIKHTTIQPAPASSSHTSEFAYFYRSYIDNENTYLVMQSNNGQKILYTIAGNQSSGSVPTKVSLWSPYAYYQGGNVPGGPSNGPNGGDNWGCAGTITYGPPPDYTAVCEFGPVRAGIPWDGLYFFPYNGCISYPAGDITGIPNSSCSDLEFRPVNDPSLAGGKLPIEPNNLTGEEWFRLDSNSTLNFDTPSETFTAIPKGFN